MSSFNTSSVAADAISYGTNIFYQFWSYLLVCLATVGHSLSIYVFTRPALHSDPCVRYFLVSTISGILVVYLNAPLLICILQNSFIHSILGKVFHMIVKD